ncbi:TlpA family protein disulfide reductase [Harryflintia acetispora]|uniref:Glutathione peroxidase n=1 Tax=Harryflintia acetispora TaxID=1849041 RepID=A0A9X8UK80_9FIRM|nr:TlpA disulfide reductase family protein [Harryflintia acetispora]TCL44128.1 glutathione peroxidase [Harryflintia acetispora]
MKRILSALLAAFLLASCAPAPGGGAKEPDSSSLPEPTISAAPGLLAQEDGKLNPGCRSELDYQLIPLREDGPDDFSRFVAQDTAGNEVNESVLEGRLTLFHLWASYCGTEVEDMRVLGELAAKYTGEGLQVIGVPMDAVDPYGEPVENAGALISDIQKLSGSSDLQLFPSQDLISIKLKDVTTVPTVFFVGEDGKMLSEQDYTGPRGEAEWEAIIKAELERYRLAQHS